MSGTVFPPGTLRLALLLGHPLGHSVSPAFQNAAFRAARIPAAYVPLDVPPGRLRGALEALRCDNVLGANVTVPYKAAVISLLDRVAPEAARWESVNTLVRRGKRLEGRSTDGEGFWRSLGAHRRRLPGSRGLIVGAGGAARAVAARLARSGAVEVAVANRSPEAARRLARLLRTTRRRVQAPVLSLQEAEREMARFDWVVQTTSLGLSPGDPAPLSLRRARPGILAVELVYHRRTRFLQEARRRRLETLDGRGMLLHQGALSFTLWTGLPAPLAAMRRALESALHRRR